MEPDLGPALLEDYEMAFGKHHFGDKFYCYGTFHLLLGQLPNIKQLRLEWASGSYYDPRIHVCYLSPSGTGKGVGANFVSRMAERLKLRYQEADKITDSALVGTVDPKSKKVEKGWLDPSHGIDILAMTEATILLNERPSRHAQDAMNILQKAMNPIGTSDSRIVKKIGYGDPITVQPECSLFLTTYTPPELSDIILRRGLLQRMYLVVNDATLEDRQAISHRRADAIKRDVDTSELEQSIAERMLRVDENYRNRRKMGFSNEAVELFRETSDMLYDHLEGLQPYIRDKLGEFVPRMETLQMKIALHWACLWGHDRIERNDAYYAKQKTDWLFELIISWLETTIEAPFEFDKRHRRMKRRVHRAMEALRQHRAYRDREDGWMRRDHLVKAVSQLEALSTPGANKHIDYLVSHDFLARKREGGEEWLRAVKDL